jgi:hypothetical protein
MALGSVTIPPSLHKHCITETWQGQHEALTACSHRVGATAYADEYNALIVVGTSSRFFFIASTASSKESTGTAAIVAAELLG